MTMVFIQGQTLTSPAGNISLSSIPQTFAHLQLRLFLRADVAALNTYLGGYFNGDGAANYARHFLAGNGATPISGATTSATLWAVDSSVAAASSISGVFSIFVIDILDYRSTIKNKTLRALSGYDNNGSGDVRISSSLWFKTPEAITTITLFNGGNFVAGSRADLYGITTSDQTGA